MTPEPEDRIAKAFNERLTTYRVKRDKANPFADDIYNRHEALRYVIEAIEVLALEAGLASRVPFTEDDA